MGEVAEDGWVVCRVFKKKNYQKSVDSPKTSPSSIDSEAQLLSSGNDVVLDQILQYMGRTCKLETESFNINNMNMNNTNSKSFMHLPRLDSPTTLPVHQETASFNHEAMLSLSELSEPSPSPGRHVVKLDNWVALDRLVASQLNCHELERPNMGEDQEEDHDHDHLQLSHFRSSRGLGFGHDTDIWGFTKSSSPSSLDPLSHLSV